MLKTLMFAAVGLALIGAPMALAAEADPAKAPAGTYKNDPRHTAVTLTFAHGAGGLSHSTYRFDKVAVTYTYDPAKPDASKVDVTIDPASIDTGVSIYDPTVADWNKEVAGERFLNAAKFPTIKFVSTKITRGAGNTGTMTGDLTFMGVTKPITLDVTYNGVNVNPRGATMGFSAKGVVKRSDFGLTAMIGPTGDDVTVTIEMEAVKPA